jgi:phospholipid-translocating ATPase
MPKEREDSGISLQEIRPELQRGLMEGSQKESETAERQVIFKGGKLCEYRCPGEPVPNTIRNQKYSILSFIPLVLFKEFQYFFNLFYLLTAISQFIPALKVGLLFSFLAPLLLVLFLTMVKEAY